MRYHDCRFRTVFSDEAQHRIIARTTAGDLRGGPGGAASHGSHPRSPVPPTQQIQMRLERTGYVSQRYGQDEPDKPGAILALAPGQKMTDLLFCLQSAGVITGRVSDEDGEPAEGVDIEVLRRW
jgi:hypothetical protein